MRRAVGKRTIRAIGSCGIPPPIHASVEPPDVLQGMRWLPRQRISTCVPNATALALFF
jgi:hypothetical protein